MFQGGGALGAYQGGVYEALHEAGIEPDWVIGTSIGAINGAIIAGNDPARRLDRLREFWSRLQHKSPWDRAAMRLLHAFATMPFVATAGDVGRQCRRADDDDLRRPRRLFFTEPGACLRAQCAGRRRESGLLYDRGLAQDTVQPDRFHAHECQGAALDRRRRQCALRQDALFRQPRHAAHAQARPCIGRLAAGLSGNSHRRRSVLGRRHLFQYADRNGVRR